MNKVSLVRNKVRFPPVVALHGSIEMIVIESFERTV